jgi:hypothetical protein
MLTEPSGHFFDSDAPLLSIPLSSFLHPASLNPYRQYRQACAILKKTTRASNPAWYRNALDLDLQLHVRPGGVELSAAFHDRRAGQWSAAPAISLEILRDSAMAAEAAVEIMKYVRASGAKALGVILHIADDFAIAELNPELDNPGALPELRDAAVKDPSSLLEDSTIDATLGSWRVLPYPAAAGGNIGTCVALTRQHVPFLEALRGAGEKEDFPVITRALSAPLVAMTGFCASARSAPGKHCVAIFQYPWFAVLAFFNEHSDLRLIRSLRHNGLLPAAKLRSALATTCASLEFIEPDLFLVPMGMDADASLEAALKPAFPGSRIERLDPPVPDSQPLRMPEALICTTPPGDSPPDGVSETLRMLRDENWATQDFLPVAAAIAETYPTRMEMRLLKLLQLGRVALFALTLLALGYFTFGILDMTRKPEWRFNPADLDMANGRLARANEERQNIQQWGNLLADRSKAWVAMEALSRLFPENAGVLVKDYSHSTKPEIASGKPSVGFVKEWQITGLARNEALEYLNALNSREGITSHFQEIARITSNEAFDPSQGNRSITANVRIQENGSFNPELMEKAVISEENSYPFSFEISITQRLESDDPLAIKAAAGPQ